MPFESPFPVVLVTGTMATMVADPEDPGTPETIIETDDHWEIHTKWSISGLGAPFIGGTWHIKAYLDDLGTGFEPGLVGSADVALSTAPAALVRDYGAVMNVTAGTVPAGAYNLIVLLTYDNLGVPLEMAGFNEGPILQFYDKLLSP